MYCVLGAQAQTRWPIVEKGAMSIQTQEVFKKLVADTIIQRDQSITIANMRKAIADTNVILNMAITPDIILVPSDMIILKNKVEGFNNVLTLATNAMTFEKNNKVNFVKSVEKSNEEIISDEKIISGKPDQPGLNLLAITLVGGVLIAKFIL